MNDHHWGLSFKLQFPDQFLGSKYVNSVRILFNIQTDTNTTIVNYANTYFKSTNFLTEDHWLLKCSSWHFTLCRFAELTCSFLMVAISMLWSDVFTESLLFSFCCFSSNRSSLSLVAEPYNMNNNTLSETSVANIRLTPKVLVTTIDAQWEGMGDVGLARYEPSLLPPRPTIRVLSYSN